MNVYENMLKLIKDEINNDPNGVGYAGKNNTQIADMLNNPYTKMMSSNILFTPPINIILAGLAFAPNSVDSTIVGQAKVFIAIT